MNILLSGTAGFIGFHLSKALISKGYEVTSVDCINAYYDTQLKYERLKALGFNKDLIDTGAEVVSSLHQNHRFLKLDLNDKKHTEIFFKKKQFDVIIHLAAQAGVRYSLTNPQAYIDDNIGGFANILEAARNQQVQHLIFASSSSVYGLNAATPYQTQQSTQHPISLYAATKKSNEMMAHAYSHLYKIPITGIRFFTVYGPWGRPDMAPMLFLKAMLNDQPIKVFNHGKMYRDFTYIDTVIEGCLRILSQPPQPDSAWNAQSPLPNRSSAPYAIYNIGGENTIQLSEFIKTLEHVTNKVAIKKFLDVPAGDVLMTHADMTDFERSFGRLNVTPLSEGLKALVDWYQATPICQQLDFATHRQ